VNIEESQLSRLSFSLHREPKRLDRRGSETIAEPSEGATREEAEDEEEPASEPSSARASVVPRVELPPVITQPNQAAQKAPEKSAGEVPAPRLPATHEITSLNELARALTIIENEAVARGGAPAAVAKGSTQPLARAVFDRWASGMTITLHPRAMYYAIVKGARAGQSQSTIAAALKRSQL
jgi:hypothetical protein